MDEKIFIIAGALAILGALAAHYRRRTVTPLLVAAVISLAWTTHFRYEYAGSNWYILNRINVYPLILWTVSLTGLYLTHSSLPKKYRLPVSILVYFLALAIIEVIGYHFLDIRLTSNYTSLLGLGIIHGSLPMKIFYVLAGPMYFSLLHRIERAMNRETI